MNIKNSVSGGVAALVVALAALTVTATPAQAQGWVFSESAGVASITTPANTNSAANVGNLDQVLGITSTLYSDSFTVSNGLLTFVRSNNYSPSGLQAALALSVGPVPVGGVSSIQFATSLSSPATDPGLFNGITNIVFNNTIKYTGPLPWATAADPFSAVNVNLSILDGAPLTSISYDYINGASNPFIFVGDGQTITAVSAVPEPSATMLCVVGGLLSVVTVVRRRRQTRF